MREFFDANDQYRSRPETPKLKECHRRQVLRRESRGPELLQSTENLSKLQDIADKAGKCDED